MSRAVYYNENEPFAVAWLRNLIARRLIPDGEVDDRSVKDVATIDVAGFRHVHLFAGIGGWAHAATLADWPVDRELWTASAPCQPWSDAGQKRGHDDPRDLWGDAFRLVCGRRPAVVMGEQVTGAARANWLDRVFDNLESIHYAARAVIVPACAVDAPHRRERIYFVAEPVADADLGGRETLSGEPDEKRHAESRGRLVADADGTHAERGARTWSRPEPPRRWWASSEPSGRRDASSWTNEEWVRGWDGRSRRVKSGLRLLADGVPGRVGRLRAYGNAIVPQVGAEVMRAFLEARP